MSLTYDVVTAAIKRLTDVMCRVHDAELDKVPLYGPLLIVSNHVNFIEIPALYTHLQPRPVTGMARASSWDNAFKRVLFDLWGAIPIRRSEADLGAMRRALAALDEGRIIAIAPEGTRSHDGLLQNAHPGVTLLALKSGAPIMPVVFYGAEQLGHNLKRLRRTDFHIIVGEAFRLDPRGVRVDKHVRRQMTDEIMYQMAALLPEPYRGVYANMEDATEEYLKFEPGARSSLLKARIDDEPDPPSPRPRRLHSPFPEGAAG